MKKILQLCNKPPRPMLDGGCIAMNTISEGLIEAGFELDLLFISTAKHPFNENAYKDPVYNNSKIESVFIDTSINIIDAFSAFMSSDSYNINRFFSSDFDFKLIRWLSDKSYDFIILESLFMTSYLPSIRKLSKAKVVLRSHNLEHIIWKRLAESAGPSPKRIYLKHLASRLRKYETGAMNEVDGIATISEKDTEHFKSLSCEKPITTIPFSVSLNDFSFRTKSFDGTLKLCHIGAMNWKPNIEAVHYLIQDIFPLLSNLNIKLNIAGRFMPEKTLSLNQEKLKVEGEVENVNTFLEENDVLIVPLTSGSGIKVKIIEGMASGKTVLTTSIGAEGIPHTSWGNLIIANTPAEFKAAIERLLKSPELMNTIGLNARETVEKEFDTKITTQKLINFFKSL